MACEVLVKIQEQQRFNWAKAKSNITKAASVLVAVKMQTCETVLHATTWQHQKVSTFPPHLENRRKCSFKISFFWISVHFIATRCLPNFLFLSCCKIMNFWPQQSPGVSEIFAPHARHEQLYIIEIPQGLTCWKSRPEPGRYISSAQNDMSNFPIALPLFLPHISDSGLRFVCPSHFHPPAVDPNRPPSPSFLSHPSG